MKSGMEPAQEAQASKHMEVIHLPFVTRGLLAGACLALGLITAGPAQAAAAHPFAAFGDAGTYTLAGGGNFEGALGGWTLTGGAAIMEGNEPFFLGSRADHRSLALPSGASATTAPVCIDQTYPWFRLLVRNRMPKTGTLKIEIVYTDTKGKLVTKGTGNHDGAPGVWSLSDTQEIKAKFDTSVAAGAAPISFRFTAPAGTSWQLDDIYVDPRARG
jgi:hypothetical protein